MAERMTPDKKEMDAHQRTDLLMRVAKLCKKQGKFQLACKKYTQAGDKSRAMKALLQTGDTERIIFFAGTARQNDVYILAANYLQSLDWHDEDVMKNIILFLTKAKEFEKLGSFYEACAQAEIDEYRDYEKASGALKEALKYLKKEVPTQPPVEQGRLDDITARIKYIEKFAAARKKEGPQMMAACEATERMQERGIILAPYLDRTMVANIYRQVGREEPNAPHDDNGVDEEVEEEVEEIDDDGRL